MSTVILPPKDIPKHTQGIFVYVEKHNRCQFDPKNWYVDTNRLSENQTPRKWIECYDLKNIDSNYGNTEEEIALRSFCVYHNIDFSVAVWIRHVRYLEWHMLMSKNTYNSLPR